jgi:hypothetical protein
LRISLRRFPAGVDRRFDDVRGEASELIRLARHGHVFSAASEAGQADEAGDDGMWTSSRNPDPARQSRAGQPMRMTIMKKIAAKYLVAAKPVKKVPVVAKPKPEKNTDAVEKPHMVPGKAHNYQYK